MSVGFGSLMGGSLRDPGHPPSPGPAAHMLAAEQVDHGASVISRALYRRHGSLAGW
jgi:hypothetical protein